MIKHSRNWVAAALAAGLVALLAAVGRSQPAERPPTHDDDGFVKVGKYRINTANILFTEDDRKGDLQVFFTGIPTLTLTGREADALRRRLDNRSASLSTPTDARLKKTRVIMEGVDILDHSRKGSVIINGIEIPDPLKTPQIDPQFERDFERKLERRVR
jgi:hypothetical protein